MRQTGPLCAHNASVEDALLRSLWSYPRQSPDFTEATKSVASWGPWLDTLHIYRQLYPQLESYKLQDLIDLFDLKPELEDKAKLYCPVNRMGFHCALYDALACALLLLRLFSQPELKKINKKQVKIKSLMVINNKLFVFLKNSYYLHAEFWSFKCTKPYYFYST